MRTDRYDLALTTSSDLAAQRYQEGLDLLLSLWPTAAHTLDQAIDADPEFALAYAARARLHAICAQTTQAKAMIAKAQALLALQGSERERSHVHVLSLAIHGQSAVALPTALQHVDAWPNDILIFSLLMGAFGLLAFSGMPDHDQARVDLCERYARHFDADDWWFLAYRGWSHGEHGNVRLARTLTEKSLAIRRQNVNAAHAHAHVFYELGASAEAEAFLTDWLPEYDRSGVLHGHIVWHSALLALERGDAQRALALYAQHIAPAANLGVPINVVSDTAGFLWRMQAYGHTVDPALWQAAANYAVRYFQQAGFAFADVHMAMIGAASGDTDAVLARAQALDALLTADKLAAGPVAPTLCRAVLAFAEERYAACARLLEPVAHEVVRIGGSAAQREIIEDTLLAAWMHSGEVDKACRLLTQRLERRPSMRDHRWQTAMHAVNPGDAGGTVAA